MFSIHRIAALTYALAIFMGGYLAVTTLKSLSTAADNQFQALSTASSYGDETPDHTILVFDKIEPASGEAN